MQWFQKNTGCDSWLKSISTLERNGSQEPRPEQTLAIWICEIMSVCEEVAGWGREIQGGGWSKAPLSTHCLIMDRIFGILPLRLAVRVKSCCRSLGVAPCLLKTWQKKMLTYITDCVNNWLTQQPLAVKRFDSINFW